MEWLRNSVIADVGQGSLDRGLLFELDAGAAWASAPASNHTTQLRQALTRNRFGQLTPGKCSV
jgi:hypothetical protein